MPTAEDLFSAGAVLLMNETQSNSAKVQRLIWHSWDAKTARNPIMLLALQHAEDAEDEVDSSSSCLLNYSMA